MKITNINQVTSQEVLVSNPTLKLICFVFEQGKGLPNHTHNGMAILQVLSGAVEINFSDGTAEQLKDGDILEFDARTEHHVIAQVQSKVLVTIIKLGGF